MGAIDFPIKNFAGLNLRDAADKVADNEFTQLQNVWQPTQGVYSPRFGSVIDQASFPLASRISGVWRHTAPNKERFSLYHCVPDATLLPDNTVDLTLLGVVDGLGNIFGGGAKVALRVCYSWIGCGLEQTYNTKNRAGFGSLVFPLDAWSNTSHQSITLANATDSLSVTIPAFPAGIRGANIFVARGTSTQMTYMGTISTSAGTLLVREFVGVTAAATDSFYGLLPSGSLTSLFNSATDVANFFQVYQAAVASANGIDAQPGTYYGGVSVDQLDAVIAARNAWHAAAKAAAGQLSNSTQYDAVVALVDNASGLITSVSAVFSGTTAANATALTLTLPALQSGSSFTIYFGTHGGALHLVTRGVTAPTYVINQLSIDPDLAPATASLQPFLYPGKINGGLLIPGTYWIGFAWVSDPGIQEGSQRTASVLVQSAQQITIDAEHNCVGVGLPSSASANGAQSIYIFIGTQDPTKHPMTFAGIGRIGANAFFDVLSIASHNAQSSPSLLGPDANLPIFYHAVNDGWVGGVQYSMGSRFQSRFGFMMAVRASTGVFQEVFPSRSLLVQALQNLKSIVFAGDSWGQSGNTAPIQLHNWAPQPKTQNDLYSAVGAIAYVQPFTWSNPPIDPSFCYLLGLSYFVNGADLPWQTDGYTLGQLGCVAAAQQTLLPPIAKYIFSYQQSLVVSGALAGNQLYASNANAPTNWATGGSGTLLRFVTIGDAAGSGITAQGIFTPATEATNNPGSFLIGFKKVGTWMANTVPDPAVSNLAGLVGGQTSASMTQISGRVGCVAYRSIVQVPQGTMFLGQDANVYLINAIREPQRVGSKVQNALLHLVGNDAAMRGVTAVFHDRHYKLSYPSPAALLLSPVVNDSELWADLRTDEGQSIKWNGPHIGRNIGPQVVLVGDSDDLSRLVADGSVVRTYTADSTTSLNDLPANGSAQVIVQKIRSKIYRLGTDTRYKRILGANISAFLDLSYANTILFEAFADSQYQSVNRLISSGGAVWDSSQWDQANYADAEYLPLSFLFGQSNLIGHTFQWAITKSDSAPFVLASVVPIVKTEKRRITA